MPTLPNDKFNFCGPFNQGASVVFDSQVSVNLYPEQAISNSKSPVALIGTPGTTLYTTLPSSSGPAIRGIWSGSWSSIDGRLFAVSDIEIFEVTGPGTQISYGLIGGGTGPCTFFANGNQLLVVDAGQGAIFIATLAGGSLTPVIYGVALEYLDGFYVAIASGLSLVNPTTLNQINASAPLDGTTWPSLAFAIRTGSADLITQLAVINGQLWIFGLKTIEIFYNAGTQPFPFARISGATINQGLLAAASVAKADNSVFWLGQDERGYAVVYRSNGLTPQRVSTWAIEYLLNSQYLSNIAFARAFSYQEAGHLFYVLSTTTISGTSVTVVYDITTNQWHLRNYRNNGTGQTSRILADCVASLGSIIGVSAYGGGNPGVYVGDYQSGQIYLQALNTPADNTAPIQRIRTSPHVSDANRWIKYRMFTLDADIGSAVPNLTYSNDGGRTFANGTPTFALHPSNNQTPGGFPRYYQRQLGRSRDRVFKIVITDSLNTIRLINAYLDIGPGTEE